jgi:glycerophosphoryl diester phosphodiesterase
MTDCRPLAIAHRAGNELPLLRAAEEAGVDLVEADVWSWRGRLEVRHTKTMGPVPLLWDRWKLAPGWTHRLTLDEVLKTASARTEFMFDLKGSDPLLPDRLIQAVNETAPGRRFTVCSQSWDLLEPFRDHPEVRVAHSIGGEKQLGMVWPRLTWHGHHVISIHRKLLSPQTVRLLKERAEMVFTWPINTAEALREVVDWGVDGVISDSIPLLRELIVARGESEPNA